MALPKVGVEAVIEGMGKFEVDSKKVNKALGNIETSTNKLGSIASEVTSKITSLGGSLLKIGALGAGAGILAIGTGLFKAGQAGLSMNDALEQASAKINAFTKDGAKTAEILEMIRDRASKTPFEFQEMANAAAGLLPASKQAGIGLEEIIEQAEILAASNPAEGLEGAAFALREAVSGDFTSIIERFNLPRAMINQLKEEGLPNLEIVSRAMQELGFDTDLVAALAETAQGRWSTFKDTLTNVAATVTQPIFTAFSQSLGDINAWLTANEPMLTAMANILANQVATAITTIAAESTRLFSAFQSGGTSGLLAALGVGPDGIALFEKVSTLVTDVATSISTLLTPALSELTSSGIMDSINDGLSFLNENFEEIKGALLGISAVVAGGVLVAIATGILALLTPVNLLVAGAALLGAAWAGNWFGIRDTLTQVWATVQPVLLGLWEWLNENIPIAIQTVSDVWNNTLKPGFTEIANAVTSQVLPALQNLWDTLTEGTGGTQSLSDLWTNTLQPALVAVGDFIVNTLFPAWVDLEVFLAGALSTAITALADYWENWLFPAMGKVQDAIGVMSDLWSETLHPALIAVGDYLNDNIIPLLESLAELHDAVLNKALEASAGLWKNVLLPAITKVGNFLKDTLSPVFEDISKSVEDDVSPVLKNLGEVIFPLLQEGLDYVTEAIKDVIGYFDSLTAKVKSFELPAILDPGSPPPMAYAFMDIAKGIDQASMSMKDFDTLMTGMTVTDKSFIDRFIDDLNMGGIAKAAGAGGGQWRNFRNILKNEISGNMQGLADGTISFMDKINEVAARFQFPPNLAREFTKVGGLVEHLTGTFAVMFQKLRIENLAASIGIANNFSSIGSSFADMVKSQIEAFNKSKEETLKLKDANTKLFETLGDQRDRLDILQKELLELTSAEELDTIAIEKKQLAIKELNEAIAKNEQSYRSNLDAIVAHRKELERKAASGSQLEATMAAIELFQGFLAGEETQLDIIKELTGDLAGSTLTVTYDRIAAQEELNRLLAVQAEQEEEIRKQQEAQKQLDFLGQQISLMKMLSDRGLDPRNILGGIKLGLEASASDLLAATNRVVEAMVEQINQDLQISSPSKVMARIGQQMMAGLQGGIASMTPVLNAQLSASVAGPLSPAMAGAMNSNSYSTTNMFNLGGNTISNGMNAAEFEAKVLNVIRRNL